MLFVLLAIAFQAPVQPVEPAVYLSFFREAAAHTDAPTHTHSGLINGTLADNIVWTSVADYIGITADESHSLVGIAALCEAEVRALDAKAGPLVMEARLQAAESDKPSTWIVEKLKELDAKRVEIIADYVAQMKTSLGGDVFRRVDDYVRARPNGNFFPVGPQAKKKI